MVHRDTLSFARLQEKKYPYPCPCPCPYQTFSVMTLFGQGQGRLLDFISLSCYINTMIVFLILYAFGLLGFGIHVYLLPPHNRTKAKIIELLLLYQLVFSMG